MQEDLDASPILLKRALCYIRVIILDRARKLGTGGNYGRRESRTCTRFPYELIGRLHTKTGESTTTAEITKVNSLMFLRFYLLHGLKQFTFILFILECSPWDAAAALRLRKSVSCFDVCLYFHSLGHQRG